MKFSSSLWIALGALSTMALVSQNVYAAGFQNQSQSATANAMASMGTANIDEPNSSFYNPAVIAMQDNFQIYVGATFLIPKTTYESIDGQRSDETESRFFPPPNAHVGVPVKLGEYGTLGLGLGVNFPYGLGITWPDGWEGQANIISQDLSTLNIHPTVSYKLPNLDLAFGAGAQIYYTSVELQRDIVLRDDTAVRSQIGGAGVGVSPSASLMYQPIKEVSIGVNYRAGVNVDLEGDAHFEGEEGTPFENSFVDQPGSTSIPYPHAVTLGLGANLEKLFIGLDVVYTTWSDYESITLDFSEPCKAGSATCDPSVDKTDPPQTAIVSNWEDAFAFRLGVEYEAIENLKLRVGGAYDMTPIPEETLSPSLPGNDRVVFSGGLGYTFSGIRADASYQFVRAMERNAAKSENLPGIYNTAAHVMAVNIGYGY